MREARGHWSARGLVLASAFAGGAWLQAQAPRLTAAEAIAKIQAATGAKLPADTVDTIKAGDPATAVTGIATTFTPTMEVLRRAVAAHENLIVTHEPTFYNHRDETAQFANDPVYQEKLAYIKEHGLVVWRFHDGWHARYPDGIAEGFVKFVGWEKYSNAGEPMFFTLPATTVGELAKSLQAKFGARAVRVVGDPALRVSHVAIRLGASGETRQLEALNHGNMEVLVAGEASEWETVEYTRDAMQQGRKKALILLGHNTSEEIGMRNCAEWLKTIFPGMPILYDPAGEPYWTPERMPR